MARLVTALSADASVPSPPRLYTLITVPLGQKYIGPLAAVLAKSDLAFASLLVRFDMYEPHPLPVFVAGAGHYWTALHAMMEHQSQLVWFRWLYVSFSRYMWVNEWIRVVPPSTTVTGNAPDPQVGV